MAGWFFRRRKGRRSLPVQSAPSSKARPLCAVEPLEARALLSAGISATAQLNLVSTVDTPSPVYNYDITVTDTGTTNIGTFWLSWIPGEDLQRTAPTAVSSPSGWSAGLTGADNSSDGVGIQWLANASASIAPGQSLNGFDFSSPDGPAELAGLSPSHTTQYILSSYVYIGAPQNDPGYQFVVADTASNTGPSISSQTALTASPTTITQGNLITFTATVTSGGGSGTAPTGTITLKDGNTTLGTQSLPANGAAALRVTNLAAGTHSIIASYGGDNTYLASSSAPLSITVNPPDGGGGGGIHLLPTITSSTLSAALVSGAAPHGNVNLAIQNDSAGLFTGPITVDLYLSSDGEIDGNSTLVAHVAKNFTIPQGSSQRLRLSLKALPATLNGAYTFLAQATDPISDVNVSPAGPTVQVSAPFVSLSESFGRLTLPLAVVAGSKTRAAATLSISNGGNVATGGATKIELFATTDGQIDGSATLIRSLTKALHIAPGKRSNVSVPLGAIPNVADGSYTIVARVTDNQQNISTTASFANAINIAAPFVALTARLGPVIPLAVKAGKSFSATLTVSNGGNALDSGAVSIDLSLSADAQSSGSLLSHQVKALSIKPGTSKVLRLHVKVPPTQPSGTFLLTASLANGNNTISNTYGGNLVITN